MRKLTFLALPLFFCDILSAQSAGQIEFFEKRIRPILANNCIACHNAKEKTAGLDLATTDGIRYAVQYGADAGKLISLEKPEDSLLLQVLEYTSQLKMPPAGKLKADLLEDMRLWIHGGAP